MRPKVGRVGDFWSKVDKGFEDESCWVWLGARDRAGYGQLQVAKKKWRAHRYSYWLANGRLPNKGDDCCHICDNPPCVRPSHLYSGTRSTNMQDCKRKGRMVPPPKRFGADSCSTLTPTDVLRIRTTPKGYGVFTRLARELSVTTETVENVFYGRTWKEGPWGER